MNYTDKVIMVTGGSRGIGKAISERFARDGGTVAIADILEDVSAQTVEDIKSTGGKAVFFKTDATKMDDVTATVDKCIEQLGKIDVLVNNIG